MNIEKRVRYHLLDGIRGVVLLSMIAYHFSWNMVYMYGAKWSWYRSIGAYIWQQSICWTFILLSGFCWSMGKQPLKRGLMVFGGGLLVTAVTLAVMPYNRVVFGVLTCIGSAMLFMIPLDRFFKKVSSEFGMILSLGAFALTRNINRGWLGFEEWNLISLPQGWYRNLLTAYFGMPPVEFYSTDYFSLIPWCFLFIAGYFLYGVCKKRNVLSWKMLQKQIPLFDYLGKHSLLVYLLHQPMLYLLLELLRGMGLI